MDRLRICVGTIVLVSMVLFWDGTALSQIDHSIDRQEEVSGQGHDAQDRRFLKGALEGGMAEVQLGQLALQKSSNSQVKTFAQKMIDDHGQMNDHLKPLAQKLGVPVPTHLDKKDQKNLAKLSALSGSEFDQAYIKEMVKDHKDALSAFHDEVDSFKPPAPQNPELQGAASDGAQVINQHLQMAKQLAKDQNVK